MKNINLPLYLALLIIPYAAHATTSPEVVAQPSPQTEVKEIAHTNIQEPSSTQEPEFKELSFEIRLLIGAVNVAIAHLVSIFIKFSFYAYNNGKYKKIKKGVEVFRIPFFWFIYCLLSTFDLVKRIFGIKLVNRKGERLSKEAFYKYAAIKFVFKGSLEGFISTFATWYHFQSDDPKAKFWSNGSVLVFATITIVDIIYVAIWKHLPYTGGVYNVKSKGGTKIFSRVYFSFLRLLLLFKRSRPDDIF